MKLSIIPSLNRQDFQEAPQWISKLIYPLNQFMTTVNQVLTNQITLQDNISCVVKQFSIVGGTLDTDNIFSFPLVLGRQIAELSAYCTNADGNYTPIYPQISWNFINNQIVINGIKELTTGKKYNFTVTVK